MHSVITTRDVFVQYNVQIRSLNGILCQLTVMFSMTLGRLYYFAISLFVLTFSRLFSALFLLIFNCFRHAFRAYINNLNTLDREFEASLKSSNCPSVLCTIILLPVASFVISCVVFCMIWQGKIRIPTTDLDITDEEILQ